ncbi:MAG: hypothetical protein GEU91_14060 [Rhizobiales bacterium]|nr:hypothetical protein [Hyphomicrobiales bacterium]
MSKRHAAPAGNGAKLLAELRAAHPHRREVILEDAARVYGEGFALAARRGGQAVMKKPAHRRPRYITVTDHALIRFMQRAGGVEMEVVRAQLAQALNRARNAADSIGQGSYRIVADGLVYVVKDDNVVTVLHEHKPLP